jgi:hypothetical protein
MNMVVCDNRLEVLRTWASLNVQRNLGSSGGLGEVYLAFDEEGGTSRVVGVAMWKVPKDLTNET